MDIKITSFPFTAKIIYHAITINFIMSPLSIKGHSKFFYIKLTILRPIIGIKQSKRLSQNY